MESDGSSTKGPGGRLEPATTGALGSKQLLEGLLALRRRSRYINLMADRHPVLLGTNIVVLLIIFSFALLSIETDPARVTWIGPGRPPKDLLTAKLVYLGRADGILVLYQPPDWGTCEVDSCRGATWKVQESDVVLHLEVNPPDRDAPRQQSLQDSRGSQGGAYFEVRSIRWN